VAGLEEAEQVFLNPVLVDGLGVVRVSLTGVRVFRPRGSGRARGRPGGWCRVPRRSGPRTPDHRARRHRGAV